MSTSLAGGSYFKKTDMLHFDYTVKELEKSSILMLFDGTYKHTSEEKKWRLATESLMFIRFGEDEDIFTAEETSFISHPDPNKSKFRVRYTEKSDIDIYMEQLNQFLNL